MADTLSSFIATLGDPLDPSPGGNLYEDIFDVCAHRPPPRNLGFIDRSSNSLTVNVNGNDFTISQSPSILASNRNGGTTGAVLWSLTPLFAKYLLSPAHPLHSLLASSTILELGSGISALIPIAFATTTSHNHNHHTPKRIIVSDQPYVLKLARQNLEGNLQGRYSILKDEARPVFVRYKVDHHVSSAGGAKGRKTGRGRKGGSVGVAAQGVASSTSSSSPSSSSSSSSSSMVIDLISLDWELDELDHHPAFVGSNERISLVLAIDCIYNEALIPPLIDTCVAACLLHATPPEQQSGRAADEKTLVMVALELRSSDVLEFFLEAFTEKFVVWRVPDDVLIDELKSGVGEAEGHSECKGSRYLVYCGVLRDEVLAVAVNGR
ncbi:hypothetical protein DFH27DRAFT_125899 [Peziza echinospora]|nr:hypothetical protein DFH27DRAFT_125899 [Peziza echinospora]